MTLVQGHCSFVTKIAADLYTSSSVEKNRIDKSVCLSEFFQPEILVVEPVFLSEFVQPESYISSCSYDQRIGFRQCPSVLFYTCKLIHGTESQVDPVTFCDYQDYLYTKL